MFIQRLLNDGPAPTLEASVRFTADRHGLLAADVANLDTPGYVQRDVSPERFRAELRRRLDRDRRAGRPGGFGVAALRARPTPRGEGILFHDGQARSVEQLVTDQAKNALTHNLMTELLRKQFDLLETAIRERVV